VDSARPPVLPSQPDVPRNLLLGLAAGLIAGVVLAFGAEVMDSTIRTPEQVQVVSALPSLGIVPMSIPLSSQTQARNGKGIVLRPGKRERVEMIAHSHPKSEIAESYRALRTSILLSSLGAPPQVILVTSALPQEGKTTTAVNCGIVLAQQGSRVLLVDADLRRPAVHHSLGIRSNGGGLSTLLAGQHSAEEVLVRSNQLSNLYVLPAGPPPPQPAELLSSALMKQWISTWRKHFDRVVIDTPPCLSVTDAVALSVVADSVVLVIRSGVTRNEAQPGPHQFNGEIDWEQFCLLASYHRLAPLACYRLQQSSDLVPAQALIRLRKSARSTAQQNLRLASELIRVLQRLQADGIRAI